MMLKTNLNEKLKMCCHKAIFDIANLIKNLLKINLHVKNRDLNLSVNKFEELYHQGNAIVCWKIPE